MSPARLTRRGRALVETFWIVVGATAVSTGYFWLLAWASSRG